MRKLFIYMVILALCGCEVIPEDERLTPVPIPESGQRTHVLLEFTGFRCVNCPTAAETAQTLLNTYGHSLTVVSLHPASNPFTQGLYDYTCPAADSIYSYMGGNATTPFPTGNIDLEASNSNYFFDHSEWAAHLSQAMQDSVCPYLSITHEINSSEQTINIVAEYTLNVDARLAIWLVEDSVLGAQAMPDGTVNMQYFHRHMLRSVAFDSPWGKPATGNMMTIEMPLPEACKPVNCHLLALLLDKNNYRILQAYEKKLAVPNAMPSLP